MRLGRSEDYSTIFWVIPAFYIKSYMAFYLSAMSQATCEIAGSNLIFKKKQMGPGCYDK